MGAWGPRAFDNDTACDWKYDLEGAEDFALVQETLEDALRGGEDEISRPRRCLLRPCRVRSRRAIPWQRRLSERLHGDRGRVGRGARAETVGGARRARSARDHSRPRQELGASRAVGRCGRCRMARSDGGPSSSPRLRAYAPPGCPGPGLALGSPFWQRVVTLDRSGGPFLARPPRFATGSPAAGVVATRSGAPRARCWQWRVRARCAFVRAGSGIRSRAARGRTVTRRAVDTWWRCPSASRASRALRGWFVRESGCGSLRA